MPARGSLPCVTPPRLDDDISTPQNPAAYAGATAPDRYERMKPRPVSPPSSDPPRGRSPPAHGSDSSAFASGFLAVSPCIIAGSVVLAGSAIGAFGVFVAGFLLHAGVPSIAPAN